MNAQVAPAEAPDQSATFGRAWRISHPDATAFPTSCGAWLVDQPGGHPFWRYHSVGAIHLRDVEGFPPAERQFVGATHEFICLALDPGKPLPQVRHWEEMAYLTPPDFACQVALPNDETATEVLDLVVKHAVTQGLELDSDRRETWNGIIRKTAEHYAPGGHA